MKARFHRRVQFDLNSALRHYYDVSLNLGDDFYDEFMKCVKIADEHPSYYHFDESGLRRCNLERFPYHFLYDARAGRIRIWVLRHDSRKPSFGIKRFD